MNTTSGWRLGKRELCGIEPTQLRCPRAVRHDPLGLVGGKAKAIDRIGELVRRDIGVEEVIRSKATSGRLIAGNRLGVIAGARYAWQRQQVIDKVFGRVLARW